MLDLRIETSSHLEVRTVALLLGAINLLRESFALALTGKTQTVAAILSIERLGQQVPIEDLLRDAGRALLEGRTWTRLPDELHAWVMYAFMRSSPLDGELRITLLEEGSVVTVMKDMLREIERMLRNSLSASNDLLPGNDGVDFAKSLRETLIAQANAPREVLELAAGLCVSAAEGLRPALAAMDARSVGVGAGAAPAPSGVPA